MRRWSALLPVAALLCGCATKYPQNEASSTFTYPLQDCTGTRLKAAASEASRADRPVLASQATLCVTPTSPAPTDDASAKAETQRLNLQAASVAEQALRTAMEAPFFKDRERSGLGIALSGGGSKASAFAMGVMAGLADHGMLDRADYMSTVSGGGYAAYFYYTHRLFPHLRSGQRIVASNEDLFRDCINSSDGIVEGPLRDRIRKVNHCERLELSSKSSDVAHIAEDIRYQALLKCSQDLLRPGYCATRTTSGLDSGVAFWGLLGTVSLFPFSNIANTLFDWGYSTAPSARTYHDGIGLAYGATLAQAAPLDPQSIERATKRCGQVAAGEQDLFDCTPNTFDPDPTALTFDELRRGLLQYREPGRQLPFWIINATATKHRSAIGWITSPATDVTNSDMFEMTAVSHGSGRYGYVSASPAIHDMTVLDSVAASAAFLDANQLVINSRALRPIVGVGLHLLNLDWGYDIANYNVSAARRRMHRSLPIPFYWGDSLAARAGLDAENADRQRSAYIRLIDGGNGENLGVYALLKRGIRNILVSDAAQDSWGKFEDICRLAGRLETSRDSLPSHLYLPGLAGFSDHCKRVDDVSYGYDIQGWLTEHPMLLGCIRKDKSTSVDQPCHNLGRGDVRLFVAKPAINHAQFSARQMKGDLGGQVTDCHVRGVDTLGPASLLNCDVALYLKYNHDVETSAMPGCPIFPQHSTSRMTANSSTTMYVAYRELARQYTAQATPILKAILDDDLDDAFETIVGWQEAHALQPKGLKCGRVPP